MKHRQFWKMCLNYACAYAIVRNTNADCRKQTVAVAKKVHTYSYTFTIYVHFVYLSQLVLQRFVQHEILFIYYHFYANYVQ